MYRLYAVYHIYGHVLQINIGAVWRVQDSGTLKSVGTTDSVVTIESCERRGLTARNAHAQLQT